MVCYILEPPSKKRRTESGGEDDELWDDSVEFTQADLEEFEVQASQVIYIICCCTSTTIAVCRCFKKINNLSIHTMSGKSRINPKQ